VTHLNCPNGDCRKIFRQNGSLAPLRPYSFVATEHPENLVIRSFASLSLPFLTRPRPPCRLLTDKSKPAAKDCRCCTWQTEL
jgi:hypothetical protein